MADQRDKAGTSDEEYYTFGREEVEMAAKMGIFPKELLVWIYISHYPVKAMQSPQHREKSYWDMKGHCPVDISWDEFNSAVDYLNRAKSIYHE